VNTNQETFSSDCWRIQQTNQCSGEDKERNDDEKQSIDEAREDLYTIIAAHRHVNTETTLHRHVNTETTDTYT